MKIVITFKDPDAVDSSIDDYPEASKQDKRKAREICKHFFKWGEYCDIEIDTETGTATVLKA